MRVGVVDYYTRPQSVSYVLAALRLLGHSAVLYSGSDPRLLEEIRQSPVTHWIFSGSDRSVKGAGAPQVPQEIFGLRGKHFLLICYSMESGLLGLGYPVHIRKKRKQGHIELGGRTVWRNHYGFVPAARLDNRVRLVEAHEGETMTVLYKNAVMTQWHPERTVDGLLFLDEWIAQKTM